MTYRVRIEDSGDRVVAVLDRPERRNAIDAQLVAELHALCAELERAPRPLVVIGRDGVFAGGADIRELRERRREDALAGINSGVFERIARLPMPTVAAVAGPALGGGAELAYACDLRIATPDSLWGNPEVQLGIVAAAGASWRLRDLVGESVARQVLLAGRRLSGEEALRFGLVVDLVADEEALLPRAHQIVDDIVKADPLALRLTKLALAAPREAHPSIDNVLQAVAFESEHKHARMTAFLEHS